MSHRNLTETAKRAVQAYGGWAFWEKVTSIRATVSARGLAFNLKRRPAFQHALIEMKVHEPESRISPIGKDGAFAGYLNGRDSGLIQWGQSLEERKKERKNARSAFSRFRQNLYWDDLDMAYFANYAFWNYFTLPVLLMRDDISWVATGPGQLEAEFPDTIPTHSRKQTFYFDSDTGLLKQHNYTAAIISRFANAANVVKEHRTIAGIPVATKRIVTPAVPSGKPLGFPVLIDIDVHSAEFQ